jgi:TonB family protein
MNLLLWIDLSVKASLVLLAAAGVTRLMPRASAASRHAVWTAALAATLILPLAKWALPATAVEVLPASFDTGVIASVTATPRTSAPGAITSVPRDTTGTSRRFEPARSSLAWKARDLVAPLWLTGVGAILLWYLTGVLGVWRLAHKSAPSHERIVGRARSIASELRVSRTLSVRSAFDERMPITWGLLRPTVLLPASAATWAATKLDDVLVHELAHSARLDVLAHRLARLTLALQWFNPIVWLAVRQAALERERACDDAVLARGALASSYADNLVDLARSLPTSAVASSAALSMARRSRLEVRVMAILDPLTNRRGLSRAAATLAAALVVGALPLATIRPVAAQARPIVTDTPVPMPARELPVKVAPTPAAGNKLETASAPMVHPTPVPQPPIDLSGSWNALIPSEAQTLFDVGLSIVPAQMTIEQSKETLTLRRMAPWGEVASVYPFDGSPARNLLDSPVHKPEGSRSEWRDQQFVISFDNGSRAVFSMEGSLLKLELQSRNGRTLFFQRGAVPSSSVERVPPPKRCEDAEARDRAAGRPEPWDVILEPGVHRSCEVGIAGPVRIRDVKPKYTPETMRAKIQGTVLVGIVIGKDGTPRNPRVLRSLDPALDNEAIKAVMASDFMPASYNRQPADVFVVFEMQFTLR